MCMLEIPTGLFLAGKSIWPFPRLGRETGFFPEISIAVLLSWSPDTMIISTVAGFFQSYMKKGPVPLVVT